MLGTLMFILVAALTTGATAKQILVIELSSGNKGARAANLLVDDLEAADPALQVDLLVLGYPRDQDKGFTLAWDPDSGLLQAPQGSQKPTHSAIIQLPDPIDPAALLGRYRGIVLLDIANNETKVQRDRLQPWWVALRDWARPGMTEGELGVVLAGRLFCEAWWQKRPGYWPDLLGRLQAFESGWLVLGTDHGDYSRYGVGDLVTELNSAPETSLGASFGNKSIGKNLDEATAQIRYTKQTASTESIILQDATRYDVLLQYSDGTPACVINHCRLLGLPSHLGLDEPLRVRIPPSWNTGRSVRLMAAPLAAASSTPPAPERMTPAIKIDERSVPAFTPPGISYDWPQSGDQIRAALSDIKSNGPVHALLWLESDAGDRVSTVCRLTP